MEKNLKEKIESYFSQIQYNGDQETTENLKPEVVEYLKTLDSKNEEDFTKAMRIAVNYISPMDFAREFGVSQPTLEKYVNGKNAPHQALRPLVLKYILTKLE